MARRLYNGTNWDTVLASTPTLSSATVSLQTYFQDGVPMTAPSTSRKVTGAFFHVNSLPSVGDFELEVRESGVAKVSGTAYNADIRLGWNYIRFTTPYQFTTLTANAYVPWMRNTAAATGTITRDGNVTVKMAIHFTYDDTPALGSTDDLWVMGFHNSGFTPQQFLAPDGFSFGSNTDAAFSTTTRWTMGAALTVGNGGIFKWDNAANCSVSMFGSWQVTNNGIIDMRGNASDISIVNTLIINSSADGVACMSSNATYGGQILMTGKTVAVESRLLAGVGTTLNPLTTMADHGYFVGAEIIIGGANTGTSDWTKDERKYVKAIPAPNQLILSDTPGGAESGLTYSHAAGSRISNMTRNVVVKPLVTTRGYWLSNQAPAGVVSDFSYARFEYANCASGKALNMDAIGNGSTMNGFVLYNNSSNGRSSIIIGAHNLPVAYNNITLYNTRGSNFFGQSGFTLAGSNNKVINTLLHFAEPGSTTNCAALSLYSSATNNIINNLHSYGANASNQTFGSAISLYSSAGNVFNDCSINGARRFGFYTSTGQQNTFNRCDFGTTASNENDIGVASATLNDFLFNQGNFGSPTLISGYQNSLEGSEYKFFEMDGNLDKHRWYRRTGSGWSGGAGLPDTTVRTPGSLSLVLKAEDATDGMYWETLIPAVPNTQVGIFGYIYRSAAFSSGTLKVELFLPGSSVADASYTYPLTTGSFLPFNISKLYTGTKSRWARVRVTAYTTTAGAYAIVDDLYDAQTGNKIAGFDLWHEGKPSAVMVATDTSSIPAQVWGYSALNHLANTMGYVVTNIEKLVKFLVVKK